MKPSQPSQKKEKQNKKKANNTPPLFCLNETPLQRTHIAPPPSLYERNAPHGRVHAVRCCGRDASSVRHCLVVRMEGGGGGKFMKQKIAQILW